MENHEGGYTNSAHMLNGTNYVIWKVRMKTYMKSLRSHVWNVVEEQYKSLKL